MIGDENGNNTGFQGVPGSSTQTRTAPSTKTGDHHGSESVNQLCSEYAACAIAQQI